MASFYLAPSLVQYRNEVNARWPQRDKASDGWIGDTSHQARPSDHNPDYSTAAKARGVYGIVRAFDTDEDLDGNRTDSGPDAWPIVEQIFANRDPRVRYLIYEGRIIAGDAGPSPWQWRPYTGANAHRHHIHLSILSTAAAESDTTPWLAPKQTGGPAPKPPTVPLEDDDMPIILAAPSRPAALLSGNEMVPFADQAALGGLNNGRVPTCPVSTADYDRFYAGFGTATDEQALAVLKQTDIRLAALVQIEAREEQRDLADG